MIGALCILAIAYRYYSAFLAAKVAAFDDTRVTPASVQRRAELSSDQSLGSVRPSFCRHFGGGAVDRTRPGDAVGLCTGLLWLLIGVCLAGAVQDMLVMAASVRRGGKSLAEIARTELGKSASVVASLAILFIVIIALAGLAIIVSESIWW